MQCERHVRKPHVCQAFRHFARERYASSRNDGCVSFVNDRFDDFAGEECNISGR